VAAAALAVLFLQVVRLSVAEHDEHLKNVERFLAETTWLPAARGSIRDRHGAVLDGKLASGLVKAALS